MICLIAVVGAALRGRPAIGTEAVVAAPRCGTRKRIAHSARKVLTGSTAAARRAGT
jgi:hypothetical protein